MEPRGVSVDQDGPLPVPVSPRLQRRLSMEEDFLYQEIMTSPRRPSLPPPYESATSLPAPSGSGHHGIGPGKGKDVATDRGGYHENSTVIDNHDEKLPNYSSSVTMEGVFSKKHEIENTVKRAEDRQWHTAYVVLNGTALSLHRAKKDWSWGKTRDGPSISPDNPPWIRKSTLQKTYSLLHADAGIAADYKKRRYVIRIRAETDQFLLSCVELSTFVKWLESLFAAIGVAAPIEERDFPRDMSIPRIQRIRWFRGESPTQMAFSVEDLPVDAVGDEMEEVPVSQEERRGSASSAVGPAPTTLVDLPPEEDSNPRPRIDPVHRLSTSSYPNIAVDPGSGKWFPEHQWSSAHDMLYAKLCYSNLLFRSPRKSSYVIKEGKQWYVDWTTGRMVRVLPPTYGEIDYFGPWQVIHTENRRI